MIRKSLSAQLDNMSGGIQSYGRAQSRRPQMHRDVPTDMIFCDEYSGDVFQLSYNGASQFLAKMHIDPCRENVEWLIEGLINTPIDETFQMENAELSIGCKCTYNPQGRSLQEMGIAKSMVCREPSMPPMRYQQMQKTDGADNRPMNEARAYMKKVGIPVGDGKGVLFGYDVLELSNALRKGIVGDGSYVGHNDINDVGGMLGKCNVEGSSKLKMGMGWQE